MKKILKPIISATVAATMIGTMGSVVFAADEADYSILEGKTISYMTAQSKFFDAYQTMADEIEKDYGCKVEFQVVPDDQYTSMTNLKLSTGEVPDVLEHNYPSQNVAMNVYEYCEDLSDEPWVSRLVNPDMLKDSKDGKMYALPKESSSGYQVVYYNKELLESCGITDPEPQNYDEFLDILKAVKENSDAAPFLQTNKDNWETQIFMTGGIPIMLGDKAGEVYEKLLNNEMEWTEIPEATEVLQRYIDLYAEGYVNEDNLSVGYDDAAQIMADGKAAMYLTVHQWATDFAKNHPEVDKNRDGEIQYVLLEGEAGHQDAISRTDFSVKTLIEKEVNLEKLSYQFADWNRGQAENRMNRLISQYKDGIELVISNNDEMALGAVEAYRKAGYEQAEWPVIFGIDGLDDALEAIKAGEMQGTVYIRRCR